MAADDPELHEGLASPIGARRTFFQWVIAAAAAIVARFGCTGCHRIHGEGGAVGPDLSFVGDSRPERTWHLQHFRNPQSVSPGSIMPKFPLTVQELNDLTSYMLSLRRGV